MNVLDASVLIAHLDDNDIHHDRATELLLETAAEPRGASPLTLAEVLVGPARTGTLDVAEIALRDLAIETVPFGDAAPVRLAVLRVQSRLRLPDCCVLLAAETARASVLTFDERLASSAADRGLAVRR